MIFSDLFITVQRHTAHAFGQSFFNTRNRMDDSANRQSLLAFYVYFCMGCHRNSNRVLTPEKHPFALAILVNYSTVYCNTQRALQKQFDIRVGEPRGSL